MQPLLFSIPDVFEVGCERVPQGEEILGVQFCTLLGSVLEKFQQAFKSVRKF